MNNSSIKRIILILITVIILGGIGYSGWCIYKGQNGGDFDEFEMIGE